MEKVCAEINFALGFLEEADMGFTECVNLGNYEVDTWVKGQMCLKKCTIIQARWKFYNTDLNFILKAV